MIFFRQLVLSLIYPKWLEKPLCFHIVHNIDVLFQNNLKAMITCNHQSQAFIHCSDDSVANVSVLVDRLNLTVRD